MPELFTRETPIICWWRQSERRLVANILNYFVVRSHHLPFMGWWLQKAGIFWLTPAGKQIRKKTGVFMRCSTGLTWKFLCSWRKKLKIYFNFKSRIFHKNRKSTASHSLMNQLKKINSSCLKALKICLLISTTVSWTLNYQLGKHYASHIENRHRRVCLTIPQQSWIRVLGKKVHNWWNTTWNLLLIKIKNIHPVNWPPNAVM